MGGVAIFLFHNLFRRASGQDLTAIASAFGAHVDDVVRHLDDIHVVLDDDDSVAFVHQFVEDVEQYVDVVEMETGGGLVEDIESVARLGACQFGGQFDALGFATAEGGGLLSEGDVA